MNNLGANKIGNNKRQAVEMGRGSGIRGRQEEDKGKGGRKGQDEICVCAVPCGECIYYVS